MIATKTSTMTTTTTSNTTTKTSNSESLKKRLKDVMSRYENLKCCDCDDMKPTWASLIVPPKGTPKEYKSTTLGCLVCFQCSGAHRRLGVHICFVRSLTLDDCKYRRKVALLPYAFSLLIPFIIFSYLRLSFQKGMNMKWKLWNWEGIVLSMMPLKPN